MSGALALGVVMLPTDPWPVAVAQARRLEEWGVGHLWTYDHLSWRRYRGREWHAALPWLTGIAMATERLRVGTMVASPTLRHPVSLAHEVMTLDHISGGRVSLGIGAGGTGFDATVLGAAPLTAGERSARLAEHVEVLDRLLRGGEVSYVGAHVVADAAVIAPGPVQRPRPPLVVAAGGPRTMAVAARHADGWVTFGDTSGANTSVADTRRVVAAQCARLDEACERAGRDPATLARTFMAGNGEERPLASLEAYAETEGWLAELGFTDLVVHHPRADDPAWDDPLEVLAQVASADRHRHP